MVLVEASCSEQQVLHQTNVVAHRARMKYPTLEGRPGFVVEEGTAFLDGPKVHVPVVFFEGTLESSGVPREASCS